VNLATDRDRFGPKGRCALQLAPDLDPFRGGWAAQAQSPVDVDAVGVQAPGDLESAVLDPEVPLDGEVALDAKMALASVQGSAFEVPDDRHVAVELGDALDAYRPVRLDSGVLLCVEVARDEPEPNLGTLGNLGGGHRAGDGDLLLYD
jgi:hypothetical protein